MRSRTLLLWPRRLVIDESWAKGEICCWSTYNQFSTGKENLWGTKVLNPKWSLCKLYFWLHWRATWKKQLKYHGWRRRQKKKKKMVSVSDYVCMCKFCSGAQFHILWVYFSILTTCLLYCLHRMWSRHAF